MLSASEEKNLLDALDDWSKREQDWKNFKNAEVVRFLKSKGFDVTIQEQYEAARTRLRLERFSGSNWTEFMQWDGVRVIRFDNRPRVIKGRDELVRRVVHLTKLEESQ